MGEMPISEARDRISELVGRSEAAVADLREADERSSVQAIQPASISSGNAVIQ